jgi:PAS domain S-box-containing protein
VKLNSKLLITYVVVGSILLAATGYYTSVSLREETFQSIHEGFIEQLYQVDFAITDFLIGVEYDVLDLVANETVRTRDAQDFTQFLDADEDTFEYNIGDKEQAIIDILNTYRLNHPYANSVYMGRENGSFVRSHPRARPTQYDPRERPWYKLALSDPYKVMRTAPYRSVTTPDVNIGTVKALLDEQGRVYGVVGVDITLRNLTDYISDISMGEAGYIVLLDDTGIVLTGYDEQVRFQTYDEAGLDYFQVVMDNTTGHTSFEEGDAKNYLFYYTSPALGWKICAVVPMEEIHGQVSRFVNRVIGILALSLLLLSVLTTLGVSRFIVKPIGELERSTQAIIQTGTLDHNIAIKTGDEIGQLADSFNNMIESMRRARDELELRVAERTAELSDANAMLKQEIAERRRAEEALRELNATLEAQVAARTAEIRAEQEKSETILRSVADAIVMADRELQIRYVNPAFTTMTGYSAKEVLGQRVNTVGAGAHSEQIQQSIEAALAEGKTWQGEVIAWRKDGRTYDAALTVAPMRDADGSLVGSVSSHWDISQRKGLERARSQFITNVSHQFRTPVTTLQLYAQLMQKTKLPEESQHHLEMIEQQTAWLTQLIQDTLEMTALDSGKAITAWEPISLPIILQNTITRYQNRAETSGLNLMAMPLPPDMPTVTGDRARLTQAIVKLVENAITFTPSGGQVVLEAGTAEDKGRTWLTLAVRDTGPGISPEEQEKVFDRFFRGELAESGHTPGTGLGLSIAQEIVRAHGGRITVESQVGEGSTFTIWLPLGE